MDLSSVYAPAVREALIKMEDERVTHQHPEPSGHVPEEAIHTSTYVELASVIMLRGVGIQLQFGFGLQFWDAGAFEFLICL